MLVAAAALPVLPLKLPGKEWSTATGRSLLHSLLPDPK